LSGFSPGDVVRCTLGGSERRGVYITERDGMAVLKLDNGYNIGVFSGDCSLVERPSPQQVTKTEVDQDLSLPHALHRVHRGDGSRAGSITGPVQ